MQINSVFNVKKTLRKQSYILVLLSTKRHYDYYDYDSRAMTKGQISLIEPRNLIVDIIWVTYGNSLKKYISTLFFFNKTKNLLKWG